MDDSDVLGVGNDSHFHGLNKEFGNNAVMPGQVPEPEEVYMPDISISGPGNGRTEDAGGSDLEESRLGDSSEEDAND